MKTTTLMMCVVAALAVFTSSVNAEKAKREASIDVELRVPGCNVNGMGQLSGKITLDTEFILAGNRIYVDADVRPDAIVDTSNTYSLWIRGLTQVRQLIATFENGVWIVTFPCSFRVERNLLINPPFSHIRFDIQYTARLTFKQVGAQVSLESASYDNFQFVCL